VVDSFDFELERKFIEQYNRLNPANELDILTLHEYLKNGLINPATEMYFDKIQELKKQLQDEKLSQHTTKIQLLLGTTKKVENKNINTCPLCFLKNNILDAGIFLLNWKQKDVNDFLNITDIPVIIDEAKLENHRKHLYIVDSESNPTTEIEENLKQISELSKIEGIDDLNILNARIANLAVLLIKLEKEGLTWKKEYKDANDSLHKFLEIKNKITEGEKIKIEGHLEISDLIKEIIKDK